MKKTTTDYYVYDGIPLDVAMARTTHLAVSAHHDDIEFMAYPAIEECFGKKDEFFGAVVLSDGAGSPRNGIYADYTDEQMKEIRKTEQEKAAFLGEYSFLAMTSYPSSELKGGSDEAVKELAAIIKKTSPKYVYTHNPADRHDTHVAAFFTTLKAIRSLDKADRPQKLYGCEVWRSLDWVCDREKLRFDASGRPNLASAIMGVFDSQISGGKRYDEATTGRRLANATYSDDHAVDGAQKISLAIDLTPLIENDELSAEDFICEKIDNFKNDVKIRLSKNGGNN